MSNKSLIFTVDTESDNQWETTNGQTTDNAKYIPRFQELCEKYSVIPVYLTDYSMSHNEWLMSYLNKKQDVGLCEIGAHLHAWDTPPGHEYDYSETGRPYLIEYPQDIMYEKLYNLTEHLNNNVNGKVVSHRAGRWAVNDSYMHMLNELGYRIDCSITPGISWSRQKGVSAGGPDYRSEKQMAEVYRGTDILEVPMSVGKVHTFNWRKEYGIVRNIGREVKSIMGRTVWLRPAICTKVEMIALIDILERRKIEYIEFMIHSSELMPGGSPYFKTEEDIDKLYRILEELFSMLSGRSYKSISLRDYYLNCDR